MRGLKGRAAWSYSRSTSASSVGSLDVNPSSSKASSGSPPSISRSPSPIPILDTLTLEPLPILDGSSVLRPVSSPESSPSPVHVATRRNLSGSPTNLVLDPVETGSRSAPQTPLLPTELVLIPATPTHDNEFSSLDFKGSQRR